MIPVSEGVLPALFTPITTRGDLDLEGLRRNLTWLAGFNPHGVLALGSTGEFLHLDLAQRQRLLETARTAAPPLPLIANISDIRPAWVARLGQVARGCGCVAVTLLPPYFFPVQDADLVEFFVRSAEAAQLPLYLYNFPERTGNRLPLEVIVDVAKRVPLAGVKHSGADFAYHAELAQLGGEHGFVVFTGADVRLRDAMAMGVTGCVSGLANAVPELVLAVYHATRDGRPAAGAASAQCLEQLDRLASTVPFPLNIGALMEARGLRVGPPKTIVSAPTTAAYGQLKHAAHAQFAQWRLEPYPDAALESCPAAGAG
jgi:4-hydroxy-tetrahydrodipicolinate synthase